ncbi:hypothetical protein [Halorubrum luteum]
MADMNRRNVLLGLGTAAAGSGVVFGSGALTSLEADREVQVEIVDATEGRLGIDASDGADSEFITQDADGVFEINDDDGNIKVQAVDREDDITLAENGLELSANPLVDADGDMVEFVVSVEDDQIVEFTDEGHDLIEDTGEDLSGDTLIIEEGATPTFDINILTETASAGETVSVVTFEAEQVDEGAPDFSPN